MNAQSTITQDHIKTTVFELIEAIAPEADLELLNPKDNVQEVLDIDSFDFLNLLIGINESFEVEIPESDYEKLTSLDEIITYIAARV